MQQNYRPNIPGMVEYPGEKYSGSKNAKKKIEKGYTLYPCTDTPPTASTLNYMPGVNTPMARSPGFAA